MMGISAGLGDSFTQIVLTPLFVSMSVMLCLDKSYFLSFVPIVFLAAFILFISYSGFMNGYFHGRESMLKRIKEVKESKIKIYFPYLFSGILGLSMNKLLFTSTIQYENIFTLIIIIFVSVFTFIRTRREK
jgi:mannose/fructose/N-acetylgalactosamine-specific phosphotransferase system component IID